MIRFSPPFGTSLESASSWQVHVGGAESNVAVGLSRLGLRSAWLSRLPETPLGHRVAREIAAHGVEVEQILWAPEERIGLCFIELGGAPRGNRVLYDRRDSALARLIPGALDYSYLSSARWLLLTGITPALSENCRKAWLRSACAAREAGRQVLLDVNYRARLWSPAEARQALEEVFPQLHVVFCGAADLALLFGLRGDAQECAQRFAERYHLSLVVLTLGAQGSVAWDAHRGVGMQAPALHTTILDRIGSGDAFLAGFLYGWGPQGDLAHGLRCGNAYAALKQTYAGDFTWADEKMLQTALTAESSDARHVDR